MKTERLLELAGLTEADKVGVEEFLQYAVDNWEVDIWPDAVEELLEMVPEAARQAWIDRQNVRG